MTKKQIIIWTIFIIFVFGAGGILTWRCWWVPREEIKKPEIAVPEEKAPPEIKPVDSELLGNAENIIKSLLTAETVYIHSDMVRDDIDDDRQEELVVFATVIGGTRPTNAGGKWNYEGQKTSSDLMILFKEEGQYIFKAYLINAFGTTNVPKIYLKDFNGDGKSEIILSDFDLESQFDVSTFIIYKLEENQLHAMSFRGDLDDSSYIRGTLKLDESKPNQLEVFHEGVSDTYIWNKDGFFEFLSTTSHKPTKLHQQVIDYLVLVDITSIVKRIPWAGRWYMQGIQFYPEDRILVGFEDGHEMGYFLGQYEVKNNEVRIEYIEETFYPEKLVELKKKYGFTVNKAVNYFPFRQDYRWTPDNVFTPF